MPRRQLVILYGALCMVAALLAWRLVRDWQRANLRYGMSARPKSAITTYFAPTARQPSTLPVSDIAAKNPFSPDRNNQVIEDTKPQAAPPLPIVFGTINLGSRYEALMTEKALSPRPSFRRVKLGEKIGEYQVVEIADDKVVVEFQGQKTTLDIYQSANTVPRTDARTAPAAAPVVESAGTAPAQPTSQASPATASSPAPPALGAEVRVTVEGNRRRYERQTMFGPSVWYEDIKK